MVRLSCPDWTGFSRAVQAYLICEGGLDRVDRICLDDRGDHRDLTEPEEDIALTTESLEIVQRCLMCSIYPFGNDIFSSTSAIVSVRSVPVLRDREEAGALDF
jgi:hypothetical protein